MRVPAEQAPPPVEIQLAEREEGVAADLGPAGWLQHEEGLSHPATTHQVMFV